MDTATVIMIVAGILLVVFAGIAVISCVRGASRVTLPEPADGEPVIGPVERLQRQLIVLNREPASKR